LERHGENDIVKRFDLILQLARGAALLTAYGLVFWVGMHVLLRGGLTVMTPAPKSDTAVGPGWEYHYEDVTLVSGRLTEQMIFQDIHQFKILLQNAGADRYELVGIMPLPTSYPSSKTAQFRLLFKRPSAFTFQSTNAVLSEAYWTAVEAERKAQDEALRASLR
jgi:hypothetical protein